MTCGRLMREWDIDLPTFIPWRTDTVEVLLRLGRRELAGELAAEQFTRPAVCQPRTQGISLRALAATEPQPRKREAALLCAIDALRECADQVQLTYAIADLADTQNQLGEYAEARSWGQQAVALAREQALEPLLARLANGRQAQQGDQPEARADDSERLTAAESRVVKLAIRGHTNRQIADKLYVTISTVEQHLTRAYRKLGVNGRADLASSFTITERSHRDRRAGRARRLTGTGSRG